MEHLVKRGEALRRRMHIGSREGRGEIRGDTNNPHYRVWFHFGVSGTVTGQRAIFNLINCSKTKNLFRLGMTPLVRSTSRPKWERLPARSCFYYRSPRHHRAYVLSFAFAFDREDDVYHFAYCFPYTYTYLQRVLAHLEAQRFDFFARELLCRTTQHRRIDLLTITSPQPLSDKRQPKRVVFITARVHPGETPASFICHGLLLFLVSDHPYARLLRNNLVFRIIPMINPDGVFLGNYRCSSMGYDLNRQWLNPSRWSHSPIFHTRKLLLEMANDPVRPLDFFVDLHAHSTCTGSFAFANTVEGPSLESGMLFPRLLGGLDRTFSIPSTKLCTDPSKLGCGRRALGEFLRVAPYCYTLEVSLFCAVDVRGRAVPYTEEAYLDLGRNLGQTFLEFYRLHAPPGPHPDISPPKRREESRGKRVSKAAA